MQDPTSSQGSRRRSWSRHTSKATCGLIKPSAPDTNPNGTGTAAGDTTTPRSMASPQRSKSIRERFFTVGAANAHLEKDRELKRLERPPYEPTHAASSFERTTTPRPPPAASTPGQEGTRYTTEPESGDYAAFVSRSEARDVARELYGDHAIEEKAPPRGRVGNRVARRIAEYVKPPREDR